MEKKTATFVKNLSGFTGTAQLFRSSVPVKYGGPYHTAYIVVSATNVPYSGPETYIFSADKEGKVLDWTELSGSFKGALDIDRALTNAGYTIIRGENS